MLQASSSWMPWPRWVFTYLDLQSCWYLEGRDSISRYLYVLQTNASRGRWLLLHSFFPQKIIDGLNMQVPVHMADTGAIRWNMSPI